METIVRGAGFKKFGLQEGWVSGNFTFRKPIGPEIWDAPIETWKHAPRTACIQHGRHRENHEARPLKSRRCGQEAGFRRLWREPPASFPRTARRPAPC